MFSDHRVTRPSSRPCRLGTPNVSTVSICPTGRHNTQQYYYYYCVLPSDDPAFTVPFGWEAPDHRSYIIGCVVDLAQKIYRTFRLPTLICSGEKSEIWPRFSTPVIFAVLWYRGMEQGSGKLKHARIVNVDYWPKYWRGRFAHPSLNVYWGHNVPNLASTLMGFGFLIEQHILNLKQAYSAPTTGLSSSTNFVYEALRGRTS